LNTNLLILGVLIVLLKFESARDIRALLQESFAPSGEEVDANREADLNEEIVE
jgi:hypothetical protein